MDNLIFSVNIVLPILLIMFAGYIAKSLKFMDEKTVSQCNSVTFKVFLPLLLFNNTRDASLESISNTSIFIFVIIAIILIFGIVTPLTIFFEKDNTKRGVIIQGIARSNYAMFGIPLVALMFPENDMALPSILIAVVIPMFNIFSVAVLTCFGTKDADFKKVLIGISKNPLIISTFTGIAFMFLDIKLPIFLDTAIRDLGSIASPFALFVLGASFKFLDIKRVYKQLITVCISRLIIVPSIVLIIAVMLGYKGIELACLMIIFASPTAASSYTMAEKMGGDSKLASSIVVFTSALSIFTVFCFILLFKNLAFI